MLEDLIALAILVGLGWWFFPEELSRLRGSTSAGSSGGLLTHPFYRLGVALAILLSLGWLNMMFALGSHNLKRLMMGKAAGNSRCYGAQRVLYHSLYAEGKTTMKPQDCPVGGVIIVDEQGYVTCQKHGRDPAREPLTP